MIFLTDLLFAYTIFKCAGKLLQNNEFHHHKNSTLLIFYLLLSKLSPGI